MYIIPEPRKITYKKSAVALTRKAQLVLEGNLSHSIVQALRELQDTMRTYWGIEIPIIRRQLSTRQKNRVDDDLVFAIDAHMEAQSYRIHIDETVREVIGGNEAGLFYGIQTLRQWVSQVSSDCGCLYVEDAPTFPVRGFYHDVTRGRVPTLDSLKALVDRMSYYKMNQLQLYVEHTYLFQGMSEMWRDETPLQAEDVMELDAYCKERYIDLVPSLSTFGHLYTLLSTKTYEAFCEYEDAEKQPFSFWERMQHHTLNVSKTDALELVKGMIDDFMPLFSSQYFNICADETFDLGKGRSQNLLVEKGEKALYLDVVKQLCDYVVTNDKIPMFWGDIISDFPEYINQLPKATICLNWGYDPEQTDRDTKALAGVSAQQYVCPGVLGWNRWMNDMKGSYENIRRMCTYGRQYKAVGVLNTDWGDYGHVNHPDFSIPGLIYGAAFSWQEEMTEKEDIDKKISRIEYQDSSKQWVSLISDIAEHAIFSWDHAVRYYEMGYLEYTKEQQKESFYEEDMERVEQANSALETIRHTLRDNLAFVDTSRRSMMQAYDIAIEGIMVWNKVGRALEQVVYSKNSQTTDAYAIAGELEEWFMDYKALWRRVSREGDLAKLSKIIFFYADILRGREYN